jgi:hypothetical protein
MLDTNNDIIRVKLSSVDSCQTDRKESHPTR